MNNKTPKDWIEVHKEKGKKEAQKRKASDVAYNPIPSMYKTFDSIALAAKDKSKETKVKMWGTSERFPDFKKSKSSKNKTFETPGPGAHNMIAHWPGNQYPGPGNYNPHVPFNHPYLSPSSRSST